MKYEVTKPSKRHFVIVFPFIGFEKFNSQYSVVLAFLCWGISITIDNEDLDKFDKYMSNLFSRTSGKMALSILLLLFVLFNLCA